MKQFLIIFLVSFICLFFLGSGIFGVNGYLYNQDLKRQIAEAEHNKDRINAEIANLKEQKSHLASEEGLRDLAVDLGYYVEGDTVFLFEDDSLQTADKDINSNSEKHYNPLSTASILILDLGISVLIAFVIWLLSRDKKNDNYYDNGDDVSESDIYINA